MMKDRRITIRLTQDEYDAIVKRKDNDENNSKGKMQGNLSVYIRNVLIAEGGQSDWKIDKELNQLNYEIRKIGLNVNQIARKLNANMGDPRDADYAIELLSEINEKIGLMEKQIDKNKGVPESGTSFLLPKTGGDDNSDNKTDAHEGGCRDSPQTPGKCNQVHTG